MRRTNFTGRIYRFFKYHPISLRVTDWLKGHSLPGLKKIPLYSLIVFIDRELKEDAVVTRASSMAFSLFMSIFPAIIVLFTLLPYTPLSSIQVEIEGELRDFEDILRSNITEVMPGDAGTMLFETINNIATKPQSGLLSFGFILAIWFASNGMLSMMRGMEKNYRVFKRRNGLQKRLIAVQLTFLIGLALAASVVFVILGNLILGFVFHYIKAGLLTRLAFFSFRWFVVLLLFYTLFSTIYRYGSSTHKPIPFINAGATLATALSVVTSWGFSFYVDNFGNYNTVYGAIGAIIVLMLWIQINCIILLIGFELNAGIAVLRDRKKGESKRDLSAEADTPDAKSLSQE